MAQPEGKSMSDPQEHRVHFHRSMHEARLLDARAAVQAGLYINGLAVTAMLAFLGSAGRDAASRHAGHMPHAFVWSLAGFGFGVFCAALAATFSYIANHQYAENQSPFSKTDEERWGHRRTAVTLHWLGYAACFLMLASFVFGVGAAVFGFDKL